MKCLIVCLLALLGVTFSGCRNQSFKLLQDAVWLQPSEPLKGVLAISGEEIRDNADAHIFSRHFGLISRHYEYIYRGLKPLRATLFRTGKHFVFEIQTDGDIELASKAYGKRMRFRISFLAPQALDLRIITTSTMKEALLLSGDLGEVKVIIDEKGRAVSAKHESNYRVEARLRLEIEKDKLRIYVPDEAIPKIATDCWSAEKATFWWDVSVGLALDPFQPIPTNLPDVYFVPEVYRIWYPEGRCSFTRFQKWTIICPSKGSDKEIP